jgi:hypothetical protein
MRISLMVVAATLAACSSTQPSPAPAPVPAPGPPNAPLSDSDLEAGPRGSIDYRCANGSVIKASYDTMGGVAIRWNGRIHELRRTKSSGSELSYSSTGYTWTASGDQFSLTERGQQVARSCRAGS